MATGPASTRSRRACAGLMSITGEPGRGPMRVGIAVGDLTAGILAAFGIMVALRERQRSGEGQWVKTSLLEALLFMLDFQGARYLMKGEVAKQVGNDHPTGVPTGAFGTRDGHINIAPTPTMWRRFCLALGRKDWIDDPDFATPAARRKNRDRVHTLIEEITAEEPAAALIQKFNEAGIPCGPIYSIDEAFADPQVQHLGIAQKVLSQALGEITILGQPVSRAARKAVSPQRRRNMASTTTRFSASSATARRRSNPSARAAQSRAQ